VRKLVRTAAVRAFSGCRLARLTSASGVDRTWQTPTVVSGFAHRRHGVQHRAGLINEVDRSLGLVRTKANLLVSNLGISLAKLFLVILRASGSKPA